MNDKAEQQSTHTANTSKNDAEKNSSQSLDKKKEKEIGGRDGLEPTRYGDWEKNGRCIDF